MPTVVLLDRTTGTRDTNMDKDTRWKRHILLLSIFLPKLCPMQGRMVANEFDSSETGEPGEPGSGEEEADDEESTDFW